ncbi:MAG: 50S ribosomal protein L18 [Candidatus Diapherotrites archaeon]|nr:50S ribosomal protein L18 [Candidatus Diapherotrites archaeon]MDZ4256016.1 50S ribosomal protein L18 [archaeon]
MTKTSTFQTSFRRRREGRTNYTKRLAFLKSGAVRAVIRKSTNHVRVQFVRSEKGMDHVITAAHTGELSTYAYTGHGGNIPAAYLVGYLAGKKFLGKEGKAAIIDIGVQRPIRGTRLFATVKGLRDAGINIPANPDAFPAESRLKGQHIEAFAGHEASKKHTVQFSTYAKKNGDWPAFSRMVERAKQQIEMGLKS